MVPITVIHDMKHITNENSLIPISTHIQKEVSNWNKQKNSCVDKIAFRSIIHKLKLDYTDRWIFNTQLRISIKV
jgi:hypothetical protein